MPIVAINQAEKGFTSKIKRSMGNHKISAKQVNSYKQWSIDCMPREFYTYLSSCCREQSNFLSLNHANHIDFHALFMLSGLEPNVDILGQTSFGTGTTSEHVLSHFTWAVCSSKRRWFFLYTKSIPSTLWHHLLVFHRKDHSEAKHEMQNVFKFSEILFALKSDGPPGRDI